jgi:cholesterol transport system auxiliary component
VRVEIIARLVSPSDRAIVAQASFEQRHPASANEIPQIILAFDEALGGVMEDIIVWTVSNPALSAKRRRL